VAWVDRHVRRPLRLLDCARARKIREDAGLTQELLAEGLGVDRVTVARWENGKRRPCRALAPRYMELLRLLEERVSADG
jgi:transcriptional regulator with XRE-family HTH domain